MLNADILLATLVFIVAHMASPRMYSLQVAVRDRAASFSGGLAVAYVCLNLLPEIGDGREYFGNHIYGVTLLGLLGFYGLDVWIERSPSRPRGATSYNLYTAVLGFYNVLIVFTLSLNLPNRIGLTLIYALSIGLHLTSSNFYLLETDRAKFTSQGRYVMVGAVIVGYALGQLRRPHEAVVDLLTAAVAGFMFFQIFRRELPDTTEAEFKPFLIGSIGFMVAHVLITLAS